MLYAVVLKSCIKHLQPKRDEVDPRATVNKQAQLLLTGFAMVVGVNDKRCSCPLFILYG